MNVWAYVEPDGRCSIVATKYQRQAEIYFDQYAPRNSLSVFRWFVQGNALAQSRPGVVFISTGVGTPSKHTEAELFEERKRC